MEAKQYIKLFFKNNKLVTLMSVLAFIILSLINMVVSFCIQVIFDYMSGKGKGTMNDLVAFVLAILVIVMAAFLIKYQAYPRFLEKDSAHIIV